MGFAAVFDNGKHYFIDNLYVLPECRGQHIATEIIGEIVEAFTDKPIKCIANNHYALKILHDHGFAEVGQNGKWKKLVKHSTGVLSV